MSLSNKRRSQLTEEVEALQTREVKHKQFEARLFLANGILQEIGELSRLRFTGIDVSFAEAITTQLYPSLIFRISPTAKHLSVLNKLLMFLCLGLIITLMTAKI